MDARIVITSTGQISLFVDAGVTAAQALALSQKVMDHLGADLDIAIVIAPPEQHRHGPGYEHQLAGAGHHVHADGVAHAH